MRTKLQDKFAILREDSSTESSTKNTPRNAHTIGPHHQCQNQKLCELIRSRSGNIPNKTLKLMMNNMKEKLQSTINGCIRLHYSSKQQKHGHIITFHKTRKLQTNQSIGQDRATSPKFTKKSYRQDYNERKQRQQSSYI